MEKKIEKGEFISQVETFARMMSEVTNGKDGVKRGLIILASESVESGDGTKQIVAVMGNGGKVIESVAALALQENGKEIIMAGVKEAALKELIEKFGGGI
ncbi:hypothetical protein [Marseilla massiliensis]|uniref:hypothetical protein n=1 Tax=Marseilla massiliensis TaxID=1841864 RepID=UPI0030C7E399